VSVLGEKQGPWKSDVMRMPALGMLRGVERVMMQIPGMYGVRFFVHSVFSSLTNRQGIEFWWEDDHLVSETYCRVVGGSGKTYHTSENGTIVVEEGWG
jgi:hypothetical protein